MLSEKQLTLACSMLAKELILRGKERTNDQKMPLIMAVKYSTRPLKLTVARHPPAIL